MPQFLIPQKTKVGEVIELPPQESHHLTAVLRRGVGDRIRLTDGRGSISLAEIRSLSRKGVSVLILTMEHEMPQKGGLRIGQALLKGDKIEFVLQKAVELGVTSFHPFISSRTIAKMREGKPKLARWRKIVHEASKQCGRASTMTVEDPLPFENLVRKNDHSKKILFWEEEGGSFGDLTPFREVFALIGPEGGFSQEEAEEARQAGFEILSLGKNILRAETAAIVAMSLIQYELGNL